MQLRLDGDDIAYGDWRVLVGEVRVIGEFLTQHGRSGSEHYVVFMTQDEWFKAPYSSEGREGCLAELGRRLKHELRCELFNATNFSSRVLWPAHLQGRPVYELIPEEPAANLFTRARQMLLHKVDMRFTDEVRRELGRV